MSRLFVGNFSFEQALDSGHSPSQSIAQFEAELACVWLAIAEEGDEILCRLPFPEAELDRLGTLGIPKAAFRSPDDIKSSSATEVVPWGWTPAIRKLSDQLRIPLTAPDHDVVCRVNSREFGFEIAKQLNVSIPGESVVRSLPELMPAIQRIHQEFGGWVIKPNHGQAGRGQLRGDGPFLSEQQFASVLHLLSKQGVVHVEPLLERIAELGAQWEIHPDGRVEWRGLTRLLTDSKGRYLGTAMNALEIEEAASENLMITQRQALEHISSLGYFGPVGIDVMLYRQREETLVRPLQDINCRWTMGRIGWEWNQRFGHIAGKELSGSWLHSYEPPAPSAVALSPLELDGTPVRCRTWWIA